MAALSPTPAPVHGLIRDACSKSTSESTLILTIFQNFLVVCVEQPRDLFLVVDDSASIGYTDIKKVRSFLSQLVSAVHVSPDMTRVGFLQFSDEKNTKIRFNLDNKFDAETVRQKFVNMKYHGGRKTLTDLALKMVVEQVRFYI